MLKYNVQLNTDNIISDTLPLRERYVSPDLSFISGVTDAAYHISSYATLQASNSLVNGDSTLTVSATNVTREGFIIIKIKNMMSKRDISMITLHQIARFLKKLGINILL